MIPPHMSRVKQPVRLIDLLRRNAVSCLRLLSVVLAFIVVCSDVSVGVKILDGQGAVYDMARTDRGHIEAEKQRLLERKKAIEAALKKAAEKERDLTRREETTMGMTFWRFFSKFRAEEYAKIIRSPEFIEYLGTDYQRGLFGLAALPADGPEKTRGRAYLEVPYGEKEAAKKAGARWDGSARRWYAPDGSDTGPLSRWIPDPALGSPPAAPDVTPGGGD
jgi:hypothetical protein